MVTDSVGASRHSKGTRTGWERARVLLEAGEVDALVTWEASRAQRDITAYAALRDLCAEHGILWCYSGRVHDLRTSDGRFRTGLDALLAEREADEIAERVQRAMRANAVKGRPHGRRLFGYQRVYDPATGELTGQIPDPDEAPVVRRIFAEYLAGTSQPAIARGLNDDGFTTSTGAKWETTQVHRVLTNPAYVAQRVHRGEVVGAAAWSALVSTEDYDRARALLDRNRTNPSQSSWKARLLSGVLRCGVCGGRMWSGHDRNQRKVYNCRTGFHVARDQATLDDYVSGLVIAYLERPDVAADLSRTSIDPATAELRDRIDTARAKLDAAIGQFTAGHLTAPTLARVEAQLLADISDAEARLRRTVIALTFDVPSEGVAAWWETLTPQQRRQVVAAVIDVIVVLPAGKGRRRFDPDRELEVSFRRLFYRPVATVCVLCHTPQRGSGIGPDHAPFVRTTRPLSPPPREALNRTHVR